jgi:hypothetical protein
MGRRSERFRKNAFHNRSHFRARSIIPFHQAVGGQRALAKLSGAAFDKAYIENEVAYHMDVIAASTKLVDRRGREDYVHVPEF